MLYFLKKLAGNPFLSGSALVVLLFGNHIGSAQVGVPADTLLPKTTPAPEKNELKYSLNADGSHYFKVTFLNQTWLRYNDSNPGTTINGEAAGQTFDIGLRRTRIQLFGQLTDRTFLYFQFGQNNFNFLNAAPVYDPGQPANGQATGNRKIAAFFHDALGEYLVFRGQDYLKIGAGLTIANGLSRFSQPSIGSIMTMDVPVFAQATVDQTDEFSRKLSLYARGQVGKIDYRFSLSDPFPINSNNGAPIRIGSNATFAPDTHHKQYQGFLTYQFLEKEPHTTPYMTGTYLGKKKVFNLEAGAITQKNAMWRSDESGAIIHEDMNLWSVAAFLDMPLNAAKATAVSAYLGYFNYDFGRNYLRYNGIMNPANGTTSPIAGVAGSQGNAFPMFGTGNIVYSQLGYLLPSDWLGTGNGALMPYVSLMYARFERLNAPMSVFNAGVNWLIKGHNSKLTLDYQNRPVYNETLNQRTRRGAVVLQYQLFI